MIYRRGTTHGKCTRKEMFYSSLKGDLNSAELFPNSFEVCKSLLEAGAKMLLGRRGVIRKDNEENLVRECMNDMYCCLVSLFEKEKTRGKELKTLTKALHSPCELKERFIAWSKDQMAGHSPGAPQRGKDSLYASCEGQDAGISKRKSYYRKRFWRTLYERGRIVRRIGHECFFTYASKDLAGLSLPDFRERLDEIASGFRLDKLDDGFPRDKDFDQGEESKYYSDGNVGKHEGPSAEQLDKFCEWLFWRVKEVFGCPYLISLNMVSEILPKCYMYFETVKLARVSSSAEEDVQTDEIAEDQLPSNRTVWLEESDLGEFFKGHIGHIRAVVKGMDREGALILCSEYNEMTRTECCKLIGQKSSGRMEEKSCKAYRNLYGALEKNGLWPDMGIYCDREEEWRLLAKYYAAGILSVVWDVWKEELERARQTRKAVQEMKGWN